MELPTGQIIRSTARKLNFFVYICNNNDKKMNIILGNRLSDEQFKIYVLDKLEPSPDNDPDCYSLCADGGFYKFEFFVEASNNWQTEIYESYVKVSDFIFIEIEPTISQMNKVNDLLTKEASRLYQERYEVDMREAECSECGKPGSYPGGICSQSCLKASMI